MSDVLKDFLISIGFAVDDSSRKKADAAVDAFEQRADASDRRTTKARLREELIRNTATADTFEKRVKSAERLEQIDEKFGGLMLRRTLRQAVAQSKTAEERIGWLDKLSKAEEAHHQRTMSGMQRVAGVALTVAATIQAATLALATYATTVAAKLEALAYSADRTGSSVASLKQFSMAVSQLGGTAGQALNDIENFAGKLRSNPQGYAGFLKTVGVEAYDAQGKLRGAAELYEEFRKNVGKKPYEQQLLYAQEMGISESTWRATDPEKLAAEKAAQRAKYDRLGYDPDRAAEDAKKLQHVLRDMFDSINIIGEKTASKIFGDLGDNLKRFTTFLEQHGDQIAEILSKVAQVVLEVSKALLQLLTSPEVKRGFDWLLGMFGQVDEGTGKWVANTERIQAALEALAVFIATVFVAKITTAFAAILKQAAPLFALLGLAGFANANGILTGPEGSRSTGEGILRTLDPGLADRVYGKTEGDKAADAKDGRSLFRRGVDAVKSGLGLGGGGSEARVSGGGTPVGSDAGNLTALIEREARAAGIDPRIMQGIRAGESGHRHNRGNPAAAYDKKDDAIESSWGPFQLNRRRGTGTEFERETGLDLRDPKTIPDQVKWVARYLRKKYDKNPNYSPFPNWQGFHGKRDADPKWGDSGYVPTPNASTSAPAPASSPVLPKLQEAARAMVDKANEGASRLDQEKLRAIGAATQGFNPSEYFKSAPPIGTSNSNTDNSTRSQSYKGGDTTVNIHTHGDVRETAELWRRHGERQRADDLRHATNIFAA